MLNKIAAWVANATRRDIPMKNSRHIITLFVALFGVSVLAKTFVPQVSPIIYKGHRYEASPDGYVIKRNVSTGNIEWKRQIYVNVYETTSGLSRCVQTCPITNMQLSNNSLIITNQKGFVYVLSLVDLTVNVVSGSIVVVNISNIRR